MAFARAVSRAASSGPSFSAVLYTRTLSAMAAPSRRDFSGTAIRILCRRNRRSVSRLRSRYSGVQKPTISRKTSVPSSWRKVKSGMNVV